MLGLISLAMLARDQISKDLAKEEQFSDSSSPCSMYSCTLPDNDTSSKTPPRHSLFTSSREGGGRSGAGRFLSYFEPKRRDELCILDRSGLWETYLRAPMGACMDQGASICPTASPSHGTISACQSAFRCSHTGACKLRHTRCLLGS